jgi:hypothetical protein
MLDASVPPTTAAVVVRMKSRRDDALSVFKSLMTVSFA